LLALGEIVEQGEGLDHAQVWGDGDRDMFHPDREEVAHYFRFQEIAAGRRYQRGDTPQSGPTGLPSGDGETTVGPSFEYVPPELRHRPAKGERRIVVMPNGSYLVYGDIPLVRKRKVVAENGESVIWEKTQTFLTEETHALCRCGESGSKPFCDGSYARVGFDGREADDPRTPGEGQLVHEGNGIVVRRDLSLRMHARFCVGRLRKVPEMMSDTSDSDMRAHITGLI
jgi:CDGSH-type Zn-finger protein